MTTELSRRATKDAADDSGMTAGEWRIVGAMPARTGRTITSTPALRRADAKIAAFKANVAARSSPSQPR